MAITKKIKKLLASIGFWSFPFFVHAQSFTNIPIEKREDVTTFVVIALAIFLLPTWISISRDHHNKGPIILINVFLGATGIGWLAALIWSVSAVKKNQPVVMPLPAISAGVVPIVQNASTGLTVANKTAAERIGDLKALMDNGTISQTEFNLLKADTFKKLG